ncbi:A-kinase anchor protein 7-like [Pristis pectinata]|uniref:A-kinase anchor protein 7-like n=1 Tax=Pristis pectinata TaxID=685728 RepID=UPI00223CC543|nr:A-kinase anchor protein 7-like [Pristis pectinata]
MDSANGSTSEEVCSQTLEELAEFPFFETDIKELFEVHDQVSGQRSHKTQPPKQKRKRTHEMGGKSLPAGEGRRKPPNYFVSIPVTNPKILDKIEDIQELVVTKEPKLLPAVVPVGRMHLTIIVAHLNTPAEVEKAVTALQQCKSKVDSILEGKPLTLLFKGIGQFNDQILFAKLSEEMNNKVISTLGAVAESVEILFRELGVNIEGSKAFKPHATFLKLSKAPILRRKGLRKICQSSTRNMKILFFGTEVFTRIDLCSMHKKNQPSGYYHCETSINVGLNSTPLSSNFLLGNSEVANTLEPPPISPEKSANRWSWKSH